MTEAAYLGGYPLFDLLPITAPLHSFNTMSINTSPLKLLFEAASNEFENRTGSNLAQHQIIDILVSCQSADSVIDVLQEQAQAFRSFRGDDGRFMMWLKQTVTVMSCMTFQPVVCSVRVLDWYALIRST